MKALANKLIHICRNIFGTWSLTSRLLIILLALIYSFSFHYFLTQSDPGFTITIPDTTTDKEKEIIEKIKEEILNQIRLELITKNKQWT